MLTEKKNHAARKFPTTPHNFSNGPSLMGPQWQQARVTESKFRAGL